MHHSEHPPSPDPSRESNDVTRREFILSGTAAVVLSGCVTAAHRETRETQPAMNPSMIRVSLRINGTACSLEIDTRTTLLDALREHLHLTGTKKGCDHGQCGACTVLVGNRRMNSCLTLAIMHQGSEITTIEGLGTPEKLHPLQSEFVRCDGYQCGYCTPGQICSAVGMVEEWKAGIPSHVTEDLTQRASFTLPELRERMSGNICRCGAYSNIAEAITSFAKDKA